MLRPLARIARPALVVATLVVPLFAEPAEAAFDILVDAALVPCVAQVPVPPIFATIQDGVNAAGPGDTVGVCPGTYVEQVAVGTSGLTIEAIGAVELFAPLAPVPMFGFDVTADDVTVRRFAATGFTGHPDSCGIRVNQANDVIVENNRVQGNSVGICFLSASDGRVRNNVASANGGTGPGNGIRVRFGSGNEVSGNTVRANPGEGIVDEAAISSSIHHNLSADNGASGIILNASASPVVANNTVRGNSVGGVIAAFTNGAVIEHNYTVENGGPGVHVFTSTACVVRRNATPFNMDGVNVRDVSFCTVSLNQANRNKRDGIGATTLGPGNQFERNSAFHNGRFDCNWDGSDAPVFLNNACGTENPPGVW